MTAGAWIEKYWTRPKVEAPPRSAKSPRATNYLWHSDGCSINKHELPHLFLFNLVFGRFVFLFCLSAKWSNVTHIQTIWVSRCRRRRVRLNLNETTKCVETVTTSCPVHGGTFFTILKWNLHADECAADTQWCTSCDAFELLPHDRAGFRTTYIIIRPHDHINNVIHWPLCIFGEPECFQWTANGFEWICDFHWFEGGGWYSVWC